MSNKGKDKQGKQHNSKKLSELQLAKPDDDEEIPFLRQRCVDEAPAPGTQVRSDKKLRLDALPISTRTKQALELAKFEVCTEIQAAAIPHALAGRDVLGAAKTGSGKTLAFVLPVIERLYTERWGREDGLAALIISPTRELAMQIFEVIRVIGRKHDLSAGLVTGGKKEYEGEQERIVGMNILVATPGRLLQHFEQTAGFDASQLLVLVLDEADRILDMGFESQLDGIISYLPNSRQTLLFSATQTKSVKALARLSLRDAQYVAVHDGHDNVAAEVTPAQLVQNYVVVKLPEKLDVLFAFLKSHLKSKIIVFFSTCSQVRYVYECFRGMQPGIPLTCLHGKIKQEKRSLVYLDFTRKKHACMFATDIAARGLDFPAVDWVVQVDAPEDTATYVHRVGRTARHTAGGRSLLLVMPSEEKVMQTALHSRGIAPKRLTVNPKKAFSVASQASALLASAPEFRLLAKKAFTGYLRSLQLLPDKDRYQDISKLPVDEFAQSLGLGFTPPLPVAPVKAGTEGARDDSRAVKNKNRGLDKIKRQIKEAKLVKKINKMLAEQGIDPESDEGAALRESIVKEKAQAEKDGSEGTGASKGRSDGSGKGKAAAGEGGFGRDEGDDAGSDSDGELFNVKPNDPSAMQFDDVGSAADAVAPTLSLVQARRKAQKDKEKAMKITSDGIAKTVAFEVGEASRKRKVIFDEAGAPVETVDPLQLVVQEQNRRNADGSAADLPTADADAIADRMRRVKQKIDEGRAADGQRERERIRAKHQKEKGEKNTADYASEDGEDDDDAGVTLMGAQSGSSSGSGSDSDSSSSSDSGDDSDAKPASKAHAKGSSAAFSKYSKDSGSNSSSNSDSDNDSDDSDADPEQLEKAALRMMSA